MVEQIDLDDGACLFEELGYLLVGVAWLSIARRVVMNQNDGVRALFYGGLEHLPRVNKGSVERSNGNKLGFDDLIFGVQVQHKEMLLRFIRNPSSHVFENVACSLYFFILVTAVMEPLVQLENRNDLHCLGLSDSFNFLEFLDCYIGKFFKGKPRNDFVTNVNNIEVFCAGAQDNGKEFSRAE